MAQLDEVVSSINYLTLVVDQPGSVSTAVDTVTSPVTVVAQQLQDLVLNINSNGPQGPPGPAGTGGGNLFIQNTAPGSPPAQYLWIQTGLGNSGQDMTFWVAS